MTDRPIPFSAPMVCAILEGRKTQTRRILNSRCRLPYAPRDRLWVREAWRTEAAYDDLSPSQMGGEEPILYVAGGQQTWGQSAIVKAGRSRAGMHMPRWASRITLLVEAVRVERLQDIDHDDVLAEGTSADDAASATGDKEATTIGAAYRRAFVALWDGINAARPGCAWADNPWVAVVRFRPVFANIDQMEAAHDPR